MCAIIDVHLYIIMTDRSGDGAADAITSPRMSSRVVPGSNANQRHSDAARSNQPLTNLKFPPTHSTCQFLRLCQRLDKPSLLGAARSALLSALALLAISQEYLPRTGSIPPRRQRGSQQSDKAETPSGSPIAATPAGQPNALTAKRRSSLHRGQRVVSINSLKLWHSAGRSISALGQGVSEILTSIVAKASRCALIR